MKRGTAGDEGKPLPAFETHATSPEGARAPCRPCHNAKRLRYGVAPRAESMATQPAREQREAWHGRHRGLAASGGAGACGRAPSRSFLPLTHPAGRQAWPVQASGSGGGDAGCRSVKPQQCPAASRRWCAPWPARRIQLSRDSALHVERSPSVSRTDNPRTRGARGPRRSPQAGSGQGLPTPALDLWPAMASGALGEREGLAADRHTSAPGSWRANPEEGEGACALWPSEEQNGKVVLQDKNRHMAPISEMGQSCNAFYIKT
jgi:hypothetical protein